VIAHLDQNKVTYRAGTFINFPTQFKTSLYKALVRFMSRIFIRSTNQPHRHVRVVRNKYDKKDKKYKKYNTAKRQRMKREAKMFQHKVVLNEIITEAANSISSALSPYFPTATPPIPMTQTRTSITSIDSPVSMRTSSESLSRRLSTNPMKTAAQEVITSNKIPAAQQADFNADLRALRNGILSVFVSLFYKFRLFWTYQPNSNPASKQKRKSPLDVLAFLEHSKQECQVL